MLTPQQRLEEGISPKDIKKFLEGELSPNEITMLMQDIIEAQVLAKMPDEVQHCVRYYASIKLVTTSRGGFH